MALARNNHRDDGGILIAEDSPTQAEQLRHALAQRFKQVTVAANGREALQAAHRHKPALVISDVVMPEMNGYELCRAIKSDDNLRDVPVVLVTTLSDPKDVLEGLACGADNFIRKPYSEKYLLSRINHVLANRELRKSERMDMGVEIVLGGQRHYVNSERQQILDLLIGTYEEAIRLNEDLKERERALAHSNRSLAGMFSIAEELNKAATERAVGEGALKRALELPGVRAGWISLVEDGDFRMLATCNLPPALEVPGAFDGLCNCRRKLLSGELDSVTNILECDRLQKAKGDTQGLLYHASVPIWGGGQSIGVVNLVGSERGLFNDDDLKNLFTVGNQLGVALARARLHGNLERLVQERTTALAAEMAERNRAEVEVRKLNTVLEQRVIERTAQLEAANKELESFSYSVSHDLRSPLRAIDGYTRMIEEDHAARVDDEGRRMLGVVRESTAYMARLIDDLLAFSRLGRKPIATAPFDMTALAREVAEELAAGYPSAKIEIAELPPALGDRTLLKQVWANLIGNALKYSAKRESPRVEIGGRPNGQENEYWVRDNGVGFDMRYADKLFGVFQRLHRQEEFPGTGVGLAIVHRVVTRHGGRVSAEGGVNEGARFSFVLPVKGGHA
ncbi:MAG: response regulator [Betaproteobacteria bacterium]|nr:response regulator [Betaproteobacteria bacterium]